MQKGKMIMVTMGITRLEAANELDRIARVCKTTTLSIACVMGANALRAEMMEQEKHDCANCSHAERPPKVYPCNNCVTGVLADRPSKWEPKEVDNGQMD